MGHTSRVDCRHVVNYSNCPAEIFDLSKMGNMQGTNNWKLGVKEPDTTPKWQARITYDSQDGLDYPRKTREVKWTEHEMEALKVPPERRDYCAHTFIPFMKCRAENWPYMWKCHHEKHDIMHCQFNDQELRVREWERERRMRIREKRLRAQQDVQNLQ